MIVSRHTHKRSSSQWVPPSAPLHNPITILRSRHSREKGSRMIQPNHMFDEPRYDLGNFQKFTDNAITTTKYSLLTFICISNIFPSKDRQMFRKMYWKHILVGDFVHISNEQDIPADVLFLRFEKFSKVVYHSASQIEGCGSQ
ncbi:hypothetical protein OSTOST_03162 [Ostertagia ostertagi]